MPRNSWRARKMKSEDIISVEDGPNAEVVVSDGRPFYDVRLAIRMDGQERAIYLQAIEALAIETALLKFVKHRFTHVSRLEGENHGETTG